MAEILGDCCAAICAICCICCTESMQQWCLFTKCCSGSGSGQTGCCGHCCKRSFDEDDFFEQEAIRERQTEAINFAPQEHSSNDVAVQQVPENGASYVGAQPGASKSMDMGKAFVPPGRPSMAGQRPSQ